MRDLQGTSVAEAVVAVLLLSVGLLGLTANLATAARLVAAGQQGTRLAAAAGVVISEFQAAGCQNVESGDRTIAPFALRWTVARDGPVLFLNLAVEEPDGPRQRIVHFVSARWCEGP